MTLINTRDQWHKKAVEWEHHLTLVRCQLVTTEFILTEIADGLSAIRFRKEAFHIIDTLTTSPHVSILSATSDLFEAGMQLFRSRKDKEWGLTDCMSFKTMEQQGLQSALTTDTHFIQAGFRSLLLEE